MFFNVSFFPIPQLLPLPGFTIKESLTDDKIAWLWGGTKSWYNKNPSLCPLLPWVSYKAQYI